jgi:hypothetical protein
MRAPVRRPAIPPALSERPRPVTMDRMYRPLAPCPSCHRHVRASDGSCPFCGTGLTVVATVPSATSRLTRGALFAFASSVVACGGTTAPEPGDTGAADTRMVVDTMQLDTLSTDTGNIAPPYGIPPEEDTGVVDDTGGPMAEYGAPPPDGG